MAMQTNEAYIATLLWAILQRLSYKRTTMCVSACVCVCVCARARVCGVLMVFFRASYKHVDQNGCRLFCSEEAPLGLLLPTAPYLRHNWAFLIY